MNNLLPMPDPPQNHHRTAVIIDVRYGVSPQYRERYTRLLQTFFMPGAMAVDVYTLGSNKEKNGPGLVKCPPELYELPDQPPQVIDLQQWANDVGYTMTVYVRPTPKECK